MRPRRAIVSALVGLVLAGCGGPIASTPSETPDATPAASRTTVTLGIFSGRPDPSWVLSEAEAAGLVDLLAELPTAAGVAPPDGGLGYHGFGVAIATLGQADRTIVAFRGTVTDSLAPPAIYRLDPERRVERFLLDTGRAHLPPDVIDAMEADLAGR